MFILLANSAFAGKFYQDSERGWYYYEHNRKKNKTENNFSKLPIPEQLEHIQKELDNRKSQMVLYPTIENARNYIEFQNAVFENASQVSKVWQAVLLKYPEFDSRIKNPVNEQALRIKYEEEGKDTNKIINEFAGNFELLLFSSDSCSYCQAFMPIINGFASQHNFKMKILDLNNQLARDLDIQGTPTLIAYNQQNNIYLPVSRGLATIEDLTRNILIIYKSLTVSPNLQ